jgi:hypothetical protein
MSVFQYMLIWQLDGGEIRNCVHFRKWMPIITKLRITAKENDVGTIYLTSTQLMDTIPLPFTLYVETYG